MMLTFNYPNCLRAVPFHLDGTLNVQHAEQPGVGSATRVIKCYEDYSLVVIVTRLRRLTSIFLRHKPSSISSCQDHLPP